MSDDDYAGLTPSEELELRRRRERDATKRFNTAVRAAYKELQEKRKAAGRRGLTPGRILAAHARDLAEGSLLYGKRGRCKAGTVPSVAKRLDTSPTTLRRAMDDHDMELPK